MRKSPLVLAIALSLYGSISHSADTFDKALNDAASAPPKTFKVNPEDVSDFDRDSALAKKGALSGRLDEDEQLKELRSIFTDTAKEKVRQRVITREKPMEPGAITKLRRELAEVEKAENEPVYGDASFQIRNVTYNPDSNKPLVISVSPGYSAQVEFYDSSGSPWGIKKDGVIGDGDSFSRKIMGEKQHIVSFVLNKTYKESNAAVILDGLPASIPILLKGTKSTVDGRVTVTLPRMGPNAEIMPVFQHEMENVSPELVKLQGGNAPAGSKPLRVNGIVGAESWFDGEYLYLALPGRLLLPPPINSSVSPTGRYLYKVSPTPYITASVNGERKGATIEGVYQTEIRRAPSVFKKDN
jgi:hypothetical protein